MNQNKVFHDNSSNEIPISCWMIFSTKIIPKFDGNKANGFDMMATMSQDKKNKSGIRKKVNFFLIQISHVVFLGSFD